MKRLLRFLLFAAVLVGAAAVAARVRARLAAPVPLGLAGAEAADPAEAEPPPAPASIPAPLAPADDLAELWGIGPVFRGRLSAAGITSFASLAAASPEAVAAATGVPEERAAGWIAEAAARAHR